MKILFKDCFYKVKKAYQTSPCGVNADSLRNPFSLYETVTGNL